MFCETETEDTSEVELSKNDPEPLNSTNGYKECSAIFLSPLLEVPSPPGASWRPGVLPLSGRDWGSEVQEGELYF